MTTTPSEGTSTTTTAPTVITTAPATVTAVPSPPPVAAAPAAPAAPTVPAATPGFPTNVPPSQMTQEQQLAYWQHWSRHHEQLWKSVEGIKAPEIEDLRAKAAELEKYKAENATEHEKAVKAAADAARAQALQETTPRLVEAEFRAAVGSRITADQLAAALEPLDKSKFLDVAGNVDLVKVAAHAALLAGVPATPTFPDLGQGQRPGTVAASVAAGKAMFEAQKKPAPTT